MILWQCLSEKLIISSASPQLGVIYFLRLSGHIFPKIARPRSLVLSDPGVPRTYAVYCSLLILLAFLPYPSCEFSHFTVTLKP